MTYVAMFSCFALAALFALMACTKLPPQAASREVPRLTAYCWIGAISMFAVGVACAVAG